MVAIVAGNGLSLFNSSNNSVGSAGIPGQAANSPRPLARAVPLAQNGYQDTLILAAGEPKHINNIVGNDLPPENFQTK